MAHINDSNTTNSWWRWIFTETKQKSLQQYGLGNEDELIHWVWGYNKSVLMIERMLTNKAERHDLSLGRPTYMPRI